MSSESPATLAIQRGCCPDGAKPEEEEEEEAGAGGAILFLFLMANSVLSYRVISKQYFQNRLFQTFKKNIIFFPCRRKLHTSIIAC